MNKSKILLERWKEKRQIMYTTFYILTFFFNILYLEVLLFPSIHNATLLFVLLVFYFDWKLAGICQVMQNKCNNSLISWYVKIQRKIIWFDLFIWWYIVFCANSSYKPLYLTVNLQKAFLIKVDFTMNSYMIFLLKQYELLR